MQSLHSQSATALLFLVFVQIHRQEIIASTCGQRIPERMKLMTNATESNYWPWHAAIFHTKNQTVLKYKCGGTLINSNSIVTAGHCVSIKNVLIDENKFSVSLGRLNLGVNEISTQSFEVIVCL